MNFCEKIKQICSKYNKVALFVDMDGTIAEYKVYQDGFITNETKELFLNSMPMRVIINELEKINEIANLDIFILTLSKSKIIEEEKKEWLKKYVPFVKKENYIILVKERNEYNQETKPYVKFRKMEEKLKDYDYVMLLDDDHKILKETQKNLKNNGEVFHISSALV